MSSDRPLHVAAFCTGLQRADVVEHLTAYDSDARLFAGREPLRDPRQEPRQRSREAGPVIDCASCWSPRLGGAPIRWTLRSTRRLRGVLIVHASSGWVLAKLDEATFTHPVAAKNRRRFEHAVGGAWPDVQEDQKDFFDMKRPAENYLSGDPGGSVRACRDAEPTEVVSQIVSLGWARGGREPRGATPARSACRGSSAPSCGSSPTSARCSTASCAVFRSARSSSGIRTGP